MYTDGCELLVLTALLTSGNQSKKFLTGWGVLLHAFFIDYIPKIDIIILIL